MSRKRCCTLLMAYIDAIGGETAAAIRLRITVTRLRRWMRGLSRPCVGGTGRGCMSREHARYVLLELARMTGQNVQRAFELTRVEMRRLEPSAPESYQVNARRAWRRYTAWYAAYTRERLQTPPTYGAVDMAALRAAIRNTLQRLSWRQREVLMLRFGLCGYSQLTLAEIAKIFRIGGEGIRQIESKAVRRLQQPDHSAVLSPFLVAYLRE